jgi:uncharacterized iron-regulated membrane protein
MGWWNTLLNVLFCLTVIFLCVSGIVMWWKRRPAGSLGAPLYPRDYRVPKAILAIGALVSVLFPLTGLGLVLFTLVDFALPRHLKEASFGRAGS